MCLFFLSIRLLRFFIFIVVAVLIFWINVAVLLSKLIFDSCSVGRLYESMGDEVDISI